GGVDDRAGEELDAALDVEAVVVPAHRVEDLLAPHALVPGDEVRVRVAEDVAGVQVAAHRGRRGVDREHLVSALGAVEAVRAVGFPASPPLGLETVDRRLVGERGHDGAGYPPPPRRPEPVGACRRGGRPEPGGGVGSGRPRPPGGEPWTRPRHQTARPSAASSARRRRPGRTPTRTTTGCGPRPRCTTCPSSTSTCSPASTTASGCCGTRR